MSDTELDSINVKNGNFNFPINLLNRGLLMNSTYYQLAFSEDAEKASSELAHILSNKI